MRPPISLVWSSSQALYKLSTAHCRAIKLGSVSDIYISNNLLNSYTKCGELGLAHNLFDEMSHRDTVSWNTMIAGCVSCGSLDTSWGFLKSMKFFGFDLDGHTFGSILKGIAYACRYDLGEIVHSLVIKSGYENNVYAGSALLDMYAKCERVDDAFRVFRGILEPNFVSWNALISGYVQVRDVKNAFWVLSCMEMEGVKLDDGTFAPVLTLLDDPALYALTKQVHGKVIRLGLENENTVCNAMITSYAECGSILDATKAFNNAVESRDLVTWNSMLAAYLNHEQEESAFGLFLEMQEIGIEPDLYTYTSLISACSGEEHNKLGKSFHGMVIKRGLEQSTPISNALISMYLHSTNNTMEDAGYVFGFLKSKDRVSWNSILTGFSQKGLSEEALKFFGHLRCSLVETDHYAYSAVLRSCSDLATLQLGQQVHSLAIKSGFESNEFVASSLIFMYAKCGVLEDAQKSFEGAPMDSTIAWNSIIFGYAQHGYGNTALELFSKMRQENVKLDHITFVGVLTACSHIGYIEQGLEYLNSMESVYKISPRMEHYACAVDLLGRARRLHEAKALIESMPFSPDSMVWKTFLGACRACNNIELATTVASYLLEIDPEEHCTYVLLLNMYGHLKRWDEKAGVTRMMKERGVKKVPGWSWIEIKNRVHSFNAGDRSHVQCDEIYLRLGELTREIRWVDFKDGLDINGPVRLDVQRPTSSV